MTEHFFSKFLKEIHISNQAFNLLPMVNNMAIVLCSTDVLPGYMYVCSMYMNVYTCNIILIMSNRYYIYLQHTHSLLAILPPLQWLAIYCSIYYLSSTGMPHTYIIFFYILPSVVTSCGSFGLY